MRFQIFELISSRFNKFFENTFHEVKEINKKYRLPHTKTTPLVKISLLMLRVYLFLLIAILFYKFITLL